MKHVIFEDFFKTIPNQWTIQTSNYLCLLWLKSDIWLWFGGLKFVLTNWRIKEVFWYGKTWGKKTQNSLMSLVDSPSNIHAWLLIYFSASQNNPSCPDVQGFGSIAPGITEMETLSSQSSNPQEIQERIKSICQVHLECARWNNAQKIKKQVMTSCHHFIILLYLCKF